MCSTIRGSTHSLPQFLNLKWVEFSGCCLGSQKSYKDVVWQSARVTVTRCHRLGAYTTEIYHVTVLEVQDPGVGRTDSSEASLLGVEMVTFCFHMIVPYVCLCPDLFF